MGSDSVNTIGPQLQVIKVFLTERRKETTYFDFNNKPRDCLRI